MEFIGLTLPTRFQAAGLTLVIKLVANIIITKMIGLPLELQVVRRVRELYYIKTTLTVHLLERALIRHGILEKLTCHSQTLS